MARRIVETQGLSPRVVAVPARLAAVTAAGLVLGGGVAIDHPRLMLAGGWPARIIGASIAGERVTLILLGRMP